MDDGARGGPLGQQCPLLGTGYQGLEHIRLHLPAHHVLGAQALKGAQVGPGPAGQRQAGDVAHPHSVGRGGFGLVAQQVRGAALPVDRIGGARDEGLGLQRLPPVAAQPRAQGLAAYLMALFPQLDPEPARTVATFVVVKNRHHFRPPGRFARSRGPSRLHQPPSVVAAEHDAQDLAKLLDRVKSPLLVNEMQRTHGFGVCEITRLKRLLAMAFFNMSSSCTNRLLTARRVRISAASAGSAGKGGWAAFYQA